MPDPLSLPLELWTWCMALAINAREAGPLELLGVSRHWDRFLLDTPSLWNQIYVQNGEDEIARISAFLHFSRGCWLHVNIMTALPTMDGLQLIAEHISRVTTISIRPGESDRITTLRVEKWKQVPSCILARLVNGRLALDVRSTSCFGISIRENGRLHYCIVLMEFAMTATANSTNNQNCITPADSPVAACSQSWEEYITRTIRISADQDANARTDSIYVLVKLVSYPQHHGAIRVAIPSCIKLLEDEDRSVRSATTDVLYEFAVYGEVSGPAIPLLILQLEHKDAGVILAAVSVLRKLAEHDYPHEKIGLTILPLIKLVERWSSSVQSAAASLLGKLAEHEEFREALTLTIPALITLLGHNNWNVRWAAVSLFAQLAEYEKIREALGFAVPSLIKHEDARVILATISLLRKLVKYDKFREALGFAIPLVISLLEHKDSGVVSASVALLGNPAEYDELHEALGLSIPVLIKLIEHEKSYVRSAAVSLLDKLAERDEFHETMRFSIPSVISLLEHWEPNVRSAAASLLGTLAGHRDLCGAMRLAIPTLINLRKHWRSDIQSRAASLLRNLA